MEELVGYCRLVAGSIGRLTVAVLGTSAPADHLADDLGVALQLTNILRDIVEDRDVLGRIYLPRTDAERFGCSPRLEGSGDDLLALISYEAAMTEPWYERGKLLLPLLDRRSRACVGAMAGIYYGLLQRIRHDPAAVLRTRVSLTGQEKAWVAARSLVGAGW
jgi:phytoene synthase